MSRGAGSPSSGRQRRPAAAAATAQLPLDLRIFVSHVAPDDPGPDSAFDQALRPVLRAVLERAAKRSPDPLDRIEVAARMSRALGREITKTMLDQWVAPSQGERRIHVDALRALMEVTADPAPLATLAESMGFRLLTADDAACAEYGAQMLVRRHLEARSRDLSGLLQDQGLAERLIARAIGGRAP
ncbi:MAG: hypothetical protein OHK0024_21210 [Thalassobaculales bacterium]